MINGRGPLFQGIGHLPGLAGRNSGAINRSNVGTRLPGLGNHRGVQHHGLAIGSLDPDHIIVPHGRAKGSGLGGFPLLDQGMGQFPQAPPKLRGSEKGLYRCMGGGGAGNDIGHQGPDGRIIIPQIQQGFGHGQGLGPVAAGISAQKHQIAHGCACRIREPLLPKGTAQKQGQPLAQIGGIFLSSGDGQLGQPAGFMPGQVGIRPIKAFHHPVKGFELLLDPGFPLAQIRSLPLHIGFNPGQIKIHTAHQSIEFFGHLGVVSGKDIGHHGPAQPGLVTDAVGLGPGPEHLFLFLGQGAGIGKDRTR